MKAYLKTQKFLKSMQDEIFNREKGTRATVQRLQVLMYIYYNPKCNNSQIAKAFGITNAGVSRNIHDMSSITSNKKLGLGLIDISFDPMQLRSTVITITDKGHLLLDPIFKELEVK